ncbi:MAG TPA: hypothetical protein VL832_07130 [Puia sp.]|jgi:hypothetical protein|nr:hypothetical protein [Puia sp.]
MYDYLKPGEEVTFQSLLDLRLIVEEVNERRGNVRCKYYDENLGKFIKLTLPAESLVPCRDLSKKKKIAVSQPVARRQNDEDNLFG